MTHILSYGLGLDSTAILARWLLEPESRDFDLADLVVITAMTGDEYSETGRLVEAHVLPLLREHSVRYIQVARASRLTSDGFVVLDDSRSPSELHLAGRYTLSREMQDSGTVPQRGGARLCSAHAKGEVLDPTIERVLNGVEQLALGHHEAEGDPWFCRPFDHYIGFAADETDRVTRDRCYGGDNRTSRYPLVEWGWTRAQAGEWLKRAFGVQWPKSCCTYCPFAWSSRAKRKQAAERLAAEPDPRLASEPLWLEAIATALNPRQQLIAKGALRVVQEHAPAVVAAFRRRLDRVDAWALYEVRRAWVSGRAYRSTRIVTRGARQALEGAVEGHARTDYGLAVEVRRPKPHGGEGTEHRFAVLPAVVEEKEHPLFALWWLRLGTLSAAGLRVDEVDFAMSLAAEVRAKWGWRRMTNARLESGWGRRYMKTEIAAAGRILREEPHSVDPAASKWWTDHRQVDIEDMLQPDFGQVGLKLDHDT